MNCLVCSKPMKKISWKITSNQKEGKDYKEYDKTSYTCDADDVWLDTEIPVEIQ